MWKTHSCAAFSQATLFIKPHTLENLNLNSASEGGSGQEFSNLFGWGVGLSFAGWERRKCFNPRRTLLWTWQMTWWQWNGNNWKKCYTRKIRRQRWSTSLDCMLSPPANPSRREQVLNMKAVTTCKKLLTIRHKLTNEKQFVSHKTQQQVEGAPENFCTLWLPWKIQ